MKLKEIVSKINWYDVRNALVLAYPESEGYLEQYLKIFKELNKIEPTDCKGMRLYVEWNNIIPEDKYIEVIGRNGKLQKESEDFEFIKNHVDENFANSEITYALEMNEWSEWLDMEVPIDVIKNFSFPAIVAHSLSEMTFMGFDQEEIRDKKKQLEESLLKAQEYMKDPEKYKDLFLDTKEIGKNSDGSLNLDELNKMINDLKNEDEEDNEFN